MSTIKDKPLKKKHTDSRITIDVIHNDILENMNNENDIYSYYLDNGLLLNDYYNQDIIITNSKKNKNNILDFFKNSNDKNDKNDKNDNNIKNENIISTYLSHVNDDYINNNFEDMEEMMHICKQCENSMIYNLQESEIICEVCGFTDKILMNNEKISYKETPREISYFAYKRINHFNEWLAQFQAKETTDIPMEVYNDVLKELNKNKHIDVSKITNKQVREILKKLKYNKFYEHIPNIINVITGNKAPSLLPQHEELLRNMFKEIQTPFMKHCPEERKNFLSYSYVLHKFCELLELDELLQYLKICNELQWQYIPSI
jgi:hypothetical protein